jgi:hypothetical protein
MSTLWPANAGILLRCGDAERRLAERGGGPVMCLRRPLSRRGSLWSPGPSAWCFWEPIVALTFLSNLRSVVLPPMVAWECSVN